MPQVFYATDKRNQQMKADAKKNVWHDWNRHLNAINDGQTVDCFCTKPPYVYPVEITPEVRIRQRVERNVAKKVIADMINAGYSLGVNDGEETTVLDSKVFDEVYAAMFTTDEDYLLVCQDGKQIGWVRFIYGNGGHDVINDYTTNLEAVMVSVNEFAEALA